MTAEQANRDIDRGWAWVVAIAAYLIMIINCITLYMGGVLYIALLERYGEGKAKTSLVGALSSGLLCFLSPVCGILINKFSCRVIMFVGCVLTTVGFSTTAFVTNLDATIVTAGVLVGCGYALTVAGLIVTVGYYFQKRRNLMISLVFVFVGVGMFISAPLGLLILDKYGLSSTFLILASIYSQTCVLAILCKPSSFERKIHLHRQMSQEAAKYSQEKNSSYFHYSVICNKAFLCFLISTCTWNFALVAAFMHLPNYLKVNGGTVSGIGWLMTSVAIGNTAGRICGAFFSSRSDDNTLVAHIVSVTLAGVITSLFPLYSSTTTGKYLFSILFGALCGCPNGMMTTLSIKFVGVCKLPEANGLSYFFCGIGVTAGPVATGYLFGLTGSYTYSFVLAGIVLLFGGILAITAAICLRCDRKSLTEESCTLELTQTKLLSSGDIIIEKQNIFASNHNVESLVKQNCGLNGSVTRQVEK